MEKRNMLSKIIFVLFLGLLLFSVTNAYADGTVTPYTSDANTVLLDHFDGSTNASILAYSENGQACGSALPSATPSSVYGSGPNGLSQSLTLNPPVGEPAGSATYLQYPGGQLLSSSNGTIEFWVYLTSYSTELAAQGPYFGSCAGWTFSMSVDSTGQLQVSAWDAFSMMSSGTNTVPLNTWTHVAASWGSAGAKLYINGVLVGSDINTGMPASGYSGSVLIRIGTHTSAIDELRVSNIQRTSFSIGSGGGDTTAPTGSISINSGATYTNSTAVTLNLSASDSVGVTGYYVSVSSTTPSASSSGWTTITSTTSYSASVSWYLSCVDGPCTIYVWYKDAAGNVSGIYSDSISFDTTAPTNGTLTATAGNAQVSLSWSGFSDATSGISSYKLMYSTSSTPSSCSVGTQICSGTTSSCTTTGLTNGTTYYYRVCAKDNAGNASTGATASATPQASDTTAPTGSITVNSGASYTNSTSVTLALSASDSVGVTGYYLSTSSTTPSSTSSTTPSASASGWTAVTSTTSYGEGVSYTLSSGDGTKTIYVWYKDAAGNVSTTYSDSIVRDTTAPADGTLTATAGDAQVSLSWSGFSDATSGIGSYRLMYSTSSTPSSCSIGAGSTGTQICSGTISSCTATGLTNGTTYYYRVCAKDNAGNASTGVTASAKPHSSAITLTLTPPTNTSIYQYGRLGPFSISITNNTSSSYTFYVYIYVVTPHGNWRSLISKSFTLSGGGTLSANNLYLNIPYVPTGTYSYYVYIYDTSYNLLDQEGFAFSVYSYYYWSPERQNHDWGVSGWTDN
ncbi:MAG: fibronectin type III domain-containing protein [Nitrospirae bacterium]|nr:fibronectin type III domain-containing protein [Nitrospirota bacterium]